MMKENNAFDVLNTLKPNIEPDSVPDKDAPVRKCYRYIKNRPGQFDYKGHWRPVYLLVPVRLKALIA